MLCGAKTGSVQRISSHLGVTSLQWPDSKQVRLAGPFSLCEFEHAYVASEFMYVVFCRYLKEPYGTGCSGPQSMYSQNGKPSPLHSPFSMHLSRLSPRKMCPGSQWYSICEWTCEWMKLYFHLFNSEFRQTSAILTL